MDPTHSILLDKIIIPKLSDNALFPKLSKPEIRGVFTLNDKCTYIEGPAALKFCKIPKSLKVNFDLDSVNNEKGTQTAEELMLNETSQLKHLLEWINRHEEEFKKRRPHFVLYRGLLSKILSTPYENKDSWQIAAVYKNGTIYLRNMETKETIQNRREFNRIPKMKIFAWWGFNFEHFLLADDPDSEPDILNCKKEECDFIFQSQLGPHNLLYCAEMDGILYKETEDYSSIKTSTEIELLKILNDTNCELVELKTTRFFPYGKMSFNFQKNNLRKWWCQSFTTKCSKIIAGLRDDEGIVKELKVFPLESLPKMGKGWTPTVCFNFLEVFLTEVKKRVDKRGSENDVVIMDYWPLRQVGNQSTGIEVRLEKNSDKILKRAI